MWKMSVFGVIQSKCRKMQARVTPKTDTFYAVQPKDYLSKNLNLYLNSFSLTRYSALLLFYTSWIAKQHWKATLGCNMLHTTFETRFVTRNAPHVHKFTYELIFTKVLTTIYFLGGWICSSQFANDKKGNNTFDLTPFFNSFSSIYTAQKMKFFIKHFFSKCD